MSSDESFLERLALALTAVKLDAVIVGMAAAAVQGAPVMTEDVDLLVRDTDRNRKKVRELCAELGGLLGRPPAQSPAAGKGALESGAYARLVLPRCRRSAQLPFVGQLHPIHHD